MKCVNIVVILLYIRFATAQFVSLSHKQPKLPCESSAKNTLIEHFFSIIFTEFHTNPPVCVCVQMCAGQSTYCYPNGCLKRDDLKRVDSPQTGTQARGDRKQYMFIVDDKNDFMKDFLEKSYVDESKTVASPIEMMRPDLFKDKYNMIVKYKKLPSAEVRYNLREQVKNMKSDFLKIENVDLSKTRWPLNKRNLITGHKVQSMIEKRVPLVRKTNVFMSMMPDNDVVAEYPPKYFKRDISKSLKDNEANVKSFYLFENPDNTTTEYYMNETISLETLIDNLINNSFKTKTNDIKNGSYLNRDDKENTINKSEVKIEKTTLNQNITIQKSIKEIPVNLTNQQDGKNKDTNGSVTTSTNKINEMITNLSKRIEKQNNTSMKIAKRIIGDFDEEDATLITTKAYKTQSNSIFTENAIEINETETTDQETTSTTPADFKDTMVTKKNRQRRARKLQNNKNNPQY